jgi:hypothetical protein
MIFDLKIMPVSTFKRTHFKNGSLWTQARNLPASGMGPVTRTRAMIQVCRNLRYVGPLGRSAAGIL